MATNSRSSAEVRDIIQTVRTPFRELDSLETFAHQVEAGTYDYKAKIPKELGEPVVVKRRGITSLAQRIEAIISWPMRPVVDLGKSGDKAAALQDDIEAFFAHDMHRCDPLGFHKGRVRFHMVHSRFGAIRLYTNSADLPKQRKGESEKVYQQRVDAWKASFWRWGYETPDPKAIGVQTESGEVTLAVIEEEIAVVDLAQYADAKGLSRDEQYSAIRAKYPTLRTSDGRAPEDAQSYMSGKLKRYVIDDGQHICIYIEQASGSGGNETEYKEVVEAFPNTFGCPSIVLFPGIERPHVDIREQYEGLMWAACELEYKLTLMESIAMTIQANPRWAQELDPQVAMQVNQMVAGGVDPKRFASSALGMKDEQGRAIVTPVQGALKDATRVLGDEFAIAYEAAKEQFAKIDQDLTAFYPPPELVERGTAAAIYAMLEGGRRQFEKQEITLSAGYGKLLNLKAHDVVHGMNPHLLTSGASKLDKPIEYVAIGTEETRSKKKIEAGKKEIAPSAFLNFPEPGTIAVEVVWSSEAQRTAAVELAMGMEAQGLATKADVLEAYGEADVSGKLVELAAWENAKLLSTGMLQFKMRDLIRRQAIREGRNEQQLLATWMPAALEAGPPGEEKQGAGGPLVGGQTYRAPAGPMSARPEAAA